MAVERGLVVNARYSFPSYERIVESCATVLRTIVYSNDDLEAALQNVPQNVGVIALLNSEHEHIGQSYIGWETALPRFARQFEGRVRSVEITNEGDLLGLPTSLIARLVKFSTPILRDHGIRSAIGAAAGSTWQDYLAELATLLDPDDFDEGGFHPYGQYIAALGDPQPGFMPGLAASIIRASELLHGKKILVSEFGAKLVDYGGTARQVAYVQASYDELDTLLASVCDCACYFAWHDAVGSPGEEGINAFGLIDAHDNPRFAWEKFSIVAAAYDPEPKEEPMPAPVFSVGHGVLDQMKATGDKPATDELYHPIGAAPGKSQYSETFGVSGTRYVYVFATNKTYRFSPTS